VAHSVGKGSDEIAVPGFIYGVAVMTLRQFLQDNFGWDIYDWEIDDIRF
jgi:hypothetical protein